MPAPEDYIRNKTDEITKSLMQNYQNKPLKGGVAHTIGKLNGDGTATLPDGSQVKIKERGTPGVYAHLYNMGNGEWLADCPSPVQIQTGGSIEKLYAMTYYTYVGLNFEYIQSYGYVIDVLDGTTYTVDSSVFEGLDVSTSQAGGFYFSLDGKDIVLHTISQNMGFDSGGKLFTIRIVKNWKINSETKIIYSEEPYQDIIVNLNFLTFGNSTAFFNYSNTEIGPKLSLVVSSFQGTSEGPIIFHYFDNWLISQNPILLGTYQINTNVGQQYAFPIQEIVINSNGDTLYYENINYSPPTGNSNPNYMIWIQNVYTNGILTYSNSVSSEGLGSLYQLYLNGRVYAVAGYNKYQPLIYIPQEIAKIPLIPYAVQFDTSPVPGYRTATGYPGGAPFLSYRGGFVATYTDGRYQVVNGGLTYNYITDISIFNYDNDGNLNQIEEYQYNMYTDFYDGPPPIGFSSNRPRAIPSNAFSLAVR